jgi:hypothetical protein
MRGYGCIKERIGRERNNEKIPCELILHPLRNKARDKADILFHLITPYLRTSKTPHNCREF